jgi:hypothetical protein
MFPNYDVSAIINDGIDFGAGPRRNRANRGGAWRQLMRSTMTQVVVDIVRCRVPSKRQGSMTQHLLPRSDPRVIQEQDRLIEYRISQARKAQQQQAGGSASNGKRAKLETAWGNVDIDWSILFCDKEHDLIHLLRCWWQCLCPFDASNFESMAIFWDVSELSSHSRSMGDEEGPPNLTSHFIYWVTLAIAQGSSGSQSQIVQHRKCFRIGSGSFLVEDAYGA